MTGIRLSVNIYFVESDAVVFAQVNRLEEESAKDIPDDHLRTSNLGLREYPQSKPAMNTPTTNNVAAIVMRMVEIMALVDSRSAAFEATTVANTSPISNSCAAATNAWVDFCSVRFSFNDVG